MVFSLIKVHEDKLEYRKMNKLRELYRFVNNNEMQNFLLDPRFQFFFKIYVEV